jgi:hypothetical protein
MTDETNPRLAAALAYVERGWHVFPCLPRLKVPATPNGWVDASTDPEKLRAWWRVNPNYNVAIATGPSNLFVVDVDPKGREAWVEMLETDPDLRTLVGQSATVETPRGGVHVYMEGAGPSTVSKLASGIDTRGERGYVLATPSYVDDGKSKGHYTGSPHGQPLQPAYNPFLAKLAKPEPVERTAPAIPDDEKVWDAPETLTRAEAWLDGLVKAGDVAVEGAGGDQRTYEVACRLLEMAIRPDTAHRLIMSVWNPHCAPPWDSAELLDKIRNAWKYGQETKGGKAERPLEQTFAHLMDADTPQIAALPPEAVAEIEARYRVKSYGEAMVNRKPLEWLIPDMMPRKGFGILYGLPATLKTFLVLDLALSIATGYGPNWWEGEREPRQVLFLAGESPDALLTKRVPAWLAMHVSPHLYPLVRDNLLVVEGVPPLEMESYYAGILSELQERGSKIALMIVDTLSRSMAGKDENSTKDAVWASNKWEAMSHRLGAFVLAVHHGGKDESRGSRGSSVWLGNPDLVLEARRPIASELSVQIHSKKVKEASMGEVPMKFDGQIYGDAPAFTRQWGYTPAPAEPTEQSKKNDTEEWSQPEALAEILTEGPLTIEHLASSLASRFGVKKPTVLRRLHDLKHGRYKAWTIDGVWKVPAGFTGKKKEEF